jgi:hypothetical protein
VNTSTHGPATNPQTGGSAILASFDGIGCVGS